MQTTMQSIMQTTAQSIMQTTMQTIIQMKYIYYQNSELDKKKLSMFDNSIIKQHNNSIGVYSYDRDFRSFIVSNEDVYVTRKAILSDNKVNEMIEKYVIESDIKRYNNNI